MFNSPRKSQEHKVYEALRGRKYFSSEEDAAFRRLRSGYEGEINFSYLIKKYLTQPYERIFDLNLKVNGSEGQFDCILISSKEVYHFEIKNFAGNYKTEGERWYNCFTDKELRNPLHQLSRGNIILNECLLRNKINLKVKSFIVFINQNFHLYKAPADNRIIYPAQINKFLNLLQTTPYIQTPKAQSIKKILTDSHLFTSAYEQIPVYHYHELKKGVFCNQCKFQVNYANRKKVKCKHCNNIATFQALLTDNIRDFNVLFPNEPIQVQSMDCWFDSTVSRSSIKRTLKNNFNLIKKGRYSHYRVG